MRRRDLLALLGAAPALRPFAARGQQKRMPVVGYLGLTSPGPFTPLLAAFHEGLGEAGFTEDRNLALEYRWAEGSLDRLAALAADLVARNVDVIATHGGVVAALVARDATKIIPIVFETGTDPVAAGLVASMARPGGNLTGVSILTAELNPKRLELLSELVPQARVIAVLVNPRNASAERVIPEIRRAADLRGVRVEIVPTDAEGDYAPAVALARAKAGALLVANDPVFFSRRDELVALAAQHAIPAIYEWREFVDAGGLMSYGTSITAMHRDKGRYVGRILAGAKPGDLPVLQPTTFELVISRKTANTLDLTIPPGLLARADEVAE
jgi:putative tryptophan/tyrosine transport system substrate-binding protein